MTLIEQIKADRNTGTPGKWEVTYERGCTHLMMRDHPNMESQMCDETYYPWVPENDTDWHRIARVPDMEAALLAADELALQAELFANSRSLTIKQLVDTLAAYRKAMGAEQ